MSDETAYIPLADSYQVDLDVFSGPLDLLLYLIRKEEVDIYDIPIARITNQYLKYIELMSTLNLEVAGEFILMAATLIRIKTRLLLPHDPDLPDEEDPRVELIQALMEYRRYKEAGEVLRERALIEEQNFVPPNPVGKIQGRVDLEPVTTLYDLLTAFHDVLKTRTEEPVHEVTQTEIRVEDRMRLVIQALRREEYASFARFFADSRRRLVAVVTFIALLELARTQRIVMYQSQPFAELRVYRGEQFFAATTETDLIDVSAELALEEVK